MKRGGWAGGGDTLGWLGDLLPGGHVDGFGERRSPRSVVGILSLRFDANKRKRKLRGDGRSTYHRSVNFYVKKLQHNQCHVS